VLASQAQGPEFKLQYLEGRKEGRKEERKEGREEKKKSLCVIKLLTTLSNPSLILPGPSEEA
jgi:hypothetical protein